MTAATNREALAACREAALAFLDRQAYLSPALRQKLLKRGFATAVVQQVLADLTAANLLNDVATARFWIDRKRESGTPVGEQRLRAALYRRGLSGDIVKQACDSADSDTGGAEERQRALRAAKSRVKALAREPDPQVRRTRMLRFLAGRGFSADVAMDTIRRMDTPDENDP
jgi:SOS response regulatory protein OraA/RecX